jgi:spectinomycin phosphotransferase
VNEAPVDLDPDELLGLVRRSWDPAVEELSYLAVGFGAHHWQARVAGAPRYFVTVDDLGLRHTAETLRAAYAGAAALADKGLHFVVPSLEPYVVDLADRAVSVTPWLDGNPVETIDRATTAAMLDQLHSVDPADLGVDLPQWRPVVDRELAHHISALAQRHWDGGPYGERARAAVTAALDDIGRWAARYAELGRVARGRSWVPTHGEPDRHNQLITGSGIVLVDWESLKLAPAERDLRTLDEGDPTMLELFDLEWRLDEINQYTNWFAGSHGNGQDDRIAFDGFLNELTR